MDGGKGQQGQVVTTSNREPPAYALPHLQGITGQAASLYGANTGYQPYGQPTIADPSMSTLGAESSLAGWAHANLGGTPNVNAAKGLAGNMISNQGMNAGTNQVASQYGSIYNDASGQENPYLQGALDAQGRRIADQVNSAMAGRGRYGSGAHTDVLSRSLAEASLPLLAQDYEQRQGRRLQATQGLGGTYDTALNRAGQYAQLAPQLDQAQLMPSQLLGMMGQQETGRAQQKINADINLWNQQQALPWEQLQRYAAIVGGAGSLGGTTTNTQPVQQPSNMQRLFGGAAAGAGLGSMFGPVGTGIGALGGGLLGMM